MTCQSFFPLALLSHVSVECLRCHLRQEHDHGQAGQDREQRCQGQGHWISVDQARIDHENAKKRAYPGNEGAGAHAGVPKKDLLN